MNKEDIKKAKSFDELLNIKYGENGTEKRNEFELNAQHFVINEMLEVTIKEAKKNQ